MANITPTYTLFDKLPAILVEWDAFTTNGDVGLAFDCWKTGNFYNHLFKGATCIITRTVAAAAFDVDVNVSMDDSTYVATNINNVTGPDVYVHEIPVGDDVETNWRYWKIDVVSIGLNNNLKVQLWLFT